MKYVAEKFCGGVYCGNGIFDTEEECMRFADDGFCDKVNIMELETQATKVIRFAPTEH